MVEVKLGGKYGTAAGNYALVSEQDSALVALFNWSAMRGKNTLYAVHDSKLGGKRLCLLMHRLILPDVEYVDHIDGNGLNNRRSNLRAVTGTENNLNGQARVRGSSKYKGVSWYSANGKWRARFQDFHLGYYALEEEAAHAYDEYAREYYGTLPTFNFPLEGERSALR